MVRSLAYLMASAVTSADTGTPYTRVSEHWGLSTARGERAGKGSGSLGPGSLLPVTDTPKDPS